MINSGEMKENVLKKKSFDFALRIVNLFKYLQDNKFENIQSDAAEIIRLLTSSIKTSKKKPH